MFTYLKGTLVAAHYNHAVIDIQGVGYYVFIPHRLFSELPHFGQQVQLHTSFVVREFSHALYGFLDHQERNFFELLMNITGVGPKLALSLIGHLSYAQLQAALAESDIATLCRVPGVGKKTAERLIVELKGKLATIAFTDQENTKGESALLKDAILALIHLGYNQNTAEKALKRSLLETPDIKDLGLLITMSLHNIHSS